MIEWNLNKPIKYNFKRNKLQFVSYRSKVFEPWTSDELSKYLQYDIIDGTKCLSLFIDDEDICPYLTPSGVPRTYLRTPLITGSSQLNMVITLTEDIPTKIVTIRDKADILNSTDEKDEDLFNITYEDGNLFFDKYNIPVSLNEPLDITIQVVHDKRELFVCIEDVAFELSFNTSKGYWFNVGIVKSPCKMFNSVRFNKLLINNE